MNKKLATAQKIEIALSRTKSLRALAEEYGVHHSTIADIYQESEQVLSQYWSDKSQRKGRPSQSRLERDEVIELTTAAQKKSALQKQLALKQMRIDFLELKLNWEQERAQEEQRQVRKQLKKKKK